MRWPDLLIGIGASLLATQAFAHHSNAMFDFSRRATVSGTVAKLEWTNPHTYVWVYVPNPGSAGGYDLYAFENGPITVMSRVGWTKTTFVAGERVSIDYVPLKNGQTGGRFLKAIQADGRIIPGDGDLPAGSEPAQKP